MFACVFLINSPFSFPSLEKNVSTETNTSVNCDPLADVLDQEMKNQPSHTII